MDEMGIPSYGEVYIDGAKPVNMDVINRHIKLGNTWRCLILEKLRRYIIAQP